MIISCVSIYGYLFYMNYKYPLSYKEIIIENCDKYNFEYGFVASLINAESGFNKDAISNKGAVGLMQIMPQTAQFVCQKINESYDFNKLKDPSFNIKTGTYYLKYLKSKFDDEVVLLCAYNAGEGVVSNWLKNNEYSLDGKTLNKIPYSSTNAYVEKIFKTRKIYNKKFL